MKGPNGVFYTHQFKINRNLKKYKIPKQIKEFKEKIRWV